MRQVNEKELKQYFKQIQLLMPLYRKREKQFIKDLKASVNEFVDINPNCTLDDIVEHFEAPQEIVNNYFSTIDTAYVCKQISVRKLMKRGIVLIVILCVLTFCIRVGMIYKIYLHERNQTISQEVTVIE